MPGIAGLLAAPGCANPSQLLDSMLQSMMHEPFYTSTAHHNTEHGWYAGSVSLAGSFADFRPVPNAAPGVFLALAGECFPDSAATSALHGGDSPFADAGWLLRLYENEGPAFVARLNGMCSGILLDPVRGHAVLFNDRYGLQRIYWHQNADGLFFASEAKALLAAVPHLREADLRSVAEYLCFDCSLEEKTFFKDVQHLPPGSLWVTAQGRTERGFYYDASQHEGQEPLALEEFSERLTAAFQEAVLRRKGSGKIGIALSGGLDTRLIMASLPAGFQDVTAYTFGGIYGDSADVSLARKISQRFKVPHHVLRLDKDFLSRYGDHAARAIYMTDGLADALSADNLYLNGLARGLAPAKITGAFGSQVLGRVKRLLRYRAPSPDLLSGDFRPMVEDAAEALTPWRHEDNLTFALKREIPAYWSRFIGCELSQVSLRLPFLDNDFVDLLHRAPRGGYDGSHYEIRAIAKLRRELLDFRTNKGDGGGAPSFITAAVKKLLRVRTLAEGSLVWDLMPYQLHHHAARVDARILSPLRLHHLILGREYFRHYSHWFRNELAPYLKDILLDPRTLARPYWNPAYLTRMVHDHVSGRRNNMLEIRKVLTLELIHRELLSSSRGETAAIPASR